MRVSFWGWCCALAAALVLARVSADEQGGDDPFGAVGAEAGGGEFGGGYGRAGGEFGGRGEFDGGGEMLGGMGMGMEGGYGMAQQVPANSGLPARWAVRRAAERRINAALDQLLQTPLDYSETPLQQITDALSDEYNIPIVFDKAALDELAISPDVELSVNLQNVTIRSALELMLNEVEDLAYLVDGEVLRITSNDRANALLVTRIYPVADLVQTDSEYGTADSKKSTIDDLIDNLIANVEHDSWMENGTGEGEMTPLAPGMLVVTQTHAVHDKLLATLADIREARAAVLKVEQAAASSLPAVVASFALNPKVLGEGDKNRKIVRDGLLASVNWDDWPADAGERYLHVVADRVLVRHTPAVVREVEQTIKALKLGPVSATGASASGRGAVSVMPAKTNSVRQTSGRGGF